MELPQGQWVAYEMPAQQLQAQPMPIRTRGSVTVLPSTTTTTNRPIVVSERDLQEVVRVSDDERFSNDDETERLRIQQEQAMNAHYTFGSTIDDSINDHSIHRQETREGLALKGMYSYSDGFFKRTIHYEADQNGYRVVK